MPINKNEITKEMITKAVKCKDAEELRVLAKAEGFAITKDEAEAYMAELADVELDGKELKSVAGGGCYTECNSECPYYCPHDIYPG
jgi:predicted ribosomally synthesized peptide with nif11-like leader